MRIWYIIFWLILGSLLLWGEMPEEVLAELDHADFKTREQASQRLKEWAVEDSDRAMVDLPRVLSRDLAPEQTERIREVLWEIFVSNGEGYLGIRFMLKPKVKFRGEVQTGVEILSVEPMSPADRSGIKVDDVILEINGEPFTHQTTKEDVVTRVRLLKPGEKVPFMIKRGRKSLKIKVRLGERKRSKEGQKLRRKEFREWLRRAIEKSQ